MARWAVGSGESKRVEGVGQLRGGVSSHPRMKALLHVTYYLTRRVSVGGGGELCQRGLAQAWPRLAQPILGQRRTVGYRPSTRCPWEKRAPASSRWATVTTTLLRRGAGGTRSLTFR